VSTHADYRPRSGKLEGELLLPTRYPVTARIPAFARELSGAHVDVWVLAVVGVALRLRLRRLTAAALLLILRGPIALARDALERLNRQPRRDRRWSGRDRMYRVHRRYSA
jgi:hypothetical protein